MIICNGSGIQLSLCLCSLPFIPRKNKNSKTGFYAEQLINICLCEWESIKEGGGGGDLFSFLKEVRVTLVEPET